MRVEEVLLGGPDHWQYAEAARVQEAKDIPTVRVLDAASVPQRKSSPHRSSIMMVGTILSLGVALMAVLASLVWEQMDEGDERKKLAMELAGAMRSTYRRLWSLPGLSWVHARLNGSQGASNNSWQVPH